MFMVKSEKFGVIQACGGSHKRVGYFRAVAFLVLLEITPRSFSSLIGNIKREAVGEKSLYQLFLAFAHAVVYFSLCYRGVVNLVSGFFKGAKLIFHPLVAAEHGYDYIGVQEDFSHGAAFWSGCLCEACGYRYWYPVDLFGRPKVRISNQPPARNYCVFPGYRSGQARSVSGPTWTGVCESLRRAAFSTVQLKGISAFVS